VFSRTIYNVSVMNSTNTTTFETGLLWDKSDGGAQYTGTQDLLLLSELNAAQQSFAGLSDFELRIPATLRELKGTNDIVVFYGEIR
jgi:hypothetical protein